MTKTMKIKSALAAVLLLLLLCGTVFMLFACGAIDEGNTNQVPGVDEPDIVKMTDDGHIIKLQPDGMTATKVDEGMLTLVKKKEFASHLEPIDLISYDKYMIAIASYEDIYTLVSFYDMENMNDGTDRLTPVRETMFFGKYFTCRIFEGSFYMLAKSASEYYQYNPELNRIEKTGVRDSIRDSKQGTAYYTELNTDKGNASSQGFLLSKLNLSNIENNSYTLSSYLSSSLQDLYFSQHAMYLIFQGTKSKGCSRIRQYSITKISLNELKVIATSKTYNGYIDNRYSLHDSGTNLFAVSSHSNTDLRVFDNSLKEVSTLTDVVSGTFVSASFDSEYCYILTSRSTAPLFKIRITDPTALVIVGYVSASGSTQMSYNFTDGFLINLGSSYGAIEVTYYDVTETMPYLINTVFINSVNTPALSTKKAVFMSFENNFFGFCSEKGAHILRIDEYGYLELAITLPKDDLKESGDYSYARVKLFNGYIYAIYANEIISYSLTDFTKTDSLTTTLTNPDILPL